MPLTSTSRYVPGHDDTAASRPRRALITALAAVRVWQLLPGRVQGAICNCAIDRGEGRPTLRRRRDRRRAWDAFWEAEHFARRVQQMLAETGEAKSRAWMLAESARHELVMGANRDAAFGRWSRCTSKREHRDASQLLSMLADVDAHVAAGTEWEIDPDSDAADDMQVMNAAESVLKRMAATANLDERMDLLEELYDAVYPLVGGQAAEVLATLPAPGRYGWDCFPVSV
jgi:hypothetical protein